MCGPSTGRAAKRGCSTASTSSTSAATWPTRDRCRPPRGCDLVFHAAAYHPIHSLDRAGALREAVSGTNVLTAAAEAEVGRLVYTSTLPPWAAAELVARPTSANFICLVQVPGSGDPAGSWAMEAEALARCCWGLPLVIVIPTAVFGPWNVKPTTGEILLNVAEGRFPVWLDLEPEHRRRPRQ